MKTTHSFFHHKKIWLSFLVGILSALLCPYGINTQLAEIQINIPWSLFLLILVSMAWGWKYGLLAGLAGGVYFPFILWPNNGWTNPLTAFIFLGYFVLIGYLYNSPQLKHKILWYLGAVILFTSAVFLFDGLFFNSLLAVNPPFWTNQTINSLTQKVVIHFAIKDSVNILILTACAELLLRTNVVRKLFGITPLSILKNNLKIFLATLSVFVVVWLIYISLVKIFVKDDLFHTIESQIALFVLFFSSVIVSRIIFYYSETHFKILKKLVSSEAKYRTIFENLRDVFYITKLDGTILEISPSIAYHSGYKRDEVIGSNFFNYYSDPDAKNSFLNVLQKNGHINDYEIELKTNNNEIIYCSVNARMVFDESGNPKQIEGILRNITERKLTEEKIRINEERFRKAQHVGKIGTFEYDIETDIFWGSDEAKRIFGLGKVSEPISLRQVEICFAEKETIAGIIKNAINTLDTVNLDYEIFNYETSEKRTINTTTEVKRDKNGNPVKALGLIMDITEKKRIERELIAAKEKAEESDRLKSAFLANMSHEIRTPMNGILGFACLLKEPGLSSENQKQFIDLIEKSGARMLNILQEIVDISKIESGQMKTNINVTKINEQIEFVYNLLKVEAEKKGIHFSYNKYLSDNEATITTDGEKIYGILTNLVKNAIKYTDKGSIEFGYAKKENYLEFFVKDTGIGIQTNRQEAIFERFIQADIFDIQARQGAGLGLSIAKAYVEMLGGKIWLESKEGAGSVFYFTIPYNRIEKEIHATKSNIPENKEESFIRKLKILIVDDDETSLLLISLMVEKYAKQILKASSGAEALELFHNNSDIDLVLLDIQIPEMNGFEVTRQIRSFNKKVIIFAQTAFAMTGDREEAIKTGCNAYITKPINKDELLGLIQNYFS